MVNDSKWRQMILNELSRLNTLCLLLLSVGVGDQDGGEEGEGCFQLNLPLSGVPTADQFFFLSGVPAADLFCFLSSVPAASLPFVFAICAPPPLMLPIPFLADVSLGILLFFAGAFLSTLVFTRSTPALLRARAIDLMLLRLSGGGVSSSSVPLERYCSSPALSRLATGWRLKPKFSVGWRSKPRPWGYMEGENRKIKE